jgi:hypothetical protein
VEEVTGRVDLFSVVISSFVVLGVAFFAAAKAAVPLI